MRESRAGRGHSSQSRESALSQGYQIHPGVEPVTDLFDGFLATVNLDFPLYLQPRPAFRLLRRPVELLGGKTTGESAKGHEWRGFRSNAGPRSGRARADRSPGRQRGRMSLSKSEAAPLHGEPSRYGPARSFRSRSWAVRLEERLMRYRGHGGGLGMSENTKSMADIGLNAEMTRFAVLSLEEAGEAAWARWPRRVNLNALLKTKLSELGLYMPLVLGCTHFVRSGVRAWPGDRTANRARAKTGCGSLSATSGFN
ncbi:hypothetical protein FQR65_LT20799 [Abscondita terminalis]|nr:hypothetical protein FQR65_LT20799 [Abscondita terminalis]